MSLNHLTDPLLNGVLNITCNSCDCKTAKIADSLEVRDFTFDALNGDKIELSTLADKGTFGAVLKSDGNNGVLWGSDNTGGISFNGTLPTADGELSLYSGIDGTTIRNSTLTETDLLNTENKANTNESDILNIQTDITDLQNDKLNIDGSILMTGNLNINNNNITNVNAMNIQEINSIAPQYGVYVKNEDFGITVFNGAVNSNLSNMMLYVASFEPAYPPIFTLNTGSQITQMKQTPTESSLFSKQTAFKLSTPATKNITLSTGTKELILDDTNSKVLCQNYDLDMNNNDITNCNEIKTDFIASSTNTDVKMNSDLNLNGKNIIGLDLINGIQPSGGLYSESSGFQVLSANTIETNLLAQGANSGSLTIPPDVFLPLNVYSFKASGTLSGGTNDIFTLRAKSLTDIPSSVPLGEIIVEIADNGLVNIWWDIQLDFTVRTTGIAGIAVLVLSGVFRYTNTNDVVRTYGRNIIINTGFDTTIQNTLELSYQNDAVNPLTNFTINQASFTKWY